MLKIDHKKSQRGFTLAELMVVVGIMAVVVGIASLSIGNALRQSRLRDATRELEGEIAMIRNSARTQQRKVVALLTANRIEAFYDMNDSGAYEPAVDFIDLSNPLNGVFDAGVDTPGMFFGHTYTNGIQFAVASTTAGAVAPLTTIRFNEMGNIVEANNMTGSNRVITVTLDSEAKRRYRIWIFTTGNTRVERSEDAGATWPTRPW